MTDLTLLDTVRKGEITSLHRVNGLKICRTADLKLTGLRLQIAERLDGGQLDRIFTLGSLGVTDVCETMEIVHVNGYISQIDVYYNTFDGVNRIDIFDE